MPNTKKNKIIEQSRIVFNEKGYDSINLNELAQFINMSRGNLSYHYSSKEDLLKAIVDQMWIEFDKEFSSTRKFPSFENLHNEVQFYYGYHKRYSFIFSSLSILSSPYLQERIKKISHHCIESNKATMLLSLSLGNLKPEPIKGLYSNIAFVTWMLTFFWLSQQVILGEKSAEECEKMIWSNIVPHFTDKGIENFKVFFGDDYYHSLGEPIDTNILKPKLF
jgi:AcrR family transcriptional regulator